MHQDHQTAFPGLGYETARTTSLGRIATWVVFALMAVGAWAAVALNTGWLLTAAEGLSFLIALPTYILLSLRYGGDASGLTTRGRITGIGWTNIVLLVLLPMLMTAYGAANAPLYGSHSVRGHWDQFVPTIPAFIVPYLFTYVWVVSTVTFFALRLLNRHLRTVLVAGLLCVSTAIGTFFLFQTDVNTIVLSQDAYSNFLWSWMRYMDEHMFSIPDYGDFPSVHVAWSVTLAIAWVRRERRWWSLGVVVLAALIITATQVLHQHSLMAAVYGIVVAIAMYAVSWWLLEYLPAVRSFRRVSDAEAASLH
ncbi:MAG: hypothetical protein Q7L55_01820 [Actinomycetota bacterium]|nr:hypothetical protein [Actinomycetota bacterium]